MARKNTVITGMDAVALKDSKVKLGLETLLQEKLGPENTAKINLDEIFQSASEWKKRTFIILGLKVTPLYDLLEQNTWTRLPAPPEKPDTSVMELVTERDARNRSVILLRIERLDSEDTAYSLRDNIRAIFDKARNEWRDDVKAIAGPVRTSRMFSAFEKKY